MSAETVRADSLQEEPASEVELMGRKRAREGSLDVAVATEPSARRENEERPSDVRRRDPVPRKPNLSWIGDVAGASPIHASSCMGELFRYIPKSERVAMPPRKRKVKSPSPSSSAPAEPLPTPALTSTPLRMSYRIARGEVRVLSFEPYKSLLLPLWRFRTVPIANTSSVALKSAFDSYISRGDFVGADMARKFMQMGYTRARRYANHKGGKKYDRSERDVEREGEGRRELPRSEGHEGMEEKAKAAEVFRVVWRECAADERYMELRKAFQKEQKEWDKTHKGVKAEAGDEIEEEVKTKPGIKVEDSAD
ncbi:hypothetical protein LTR95_009624 [Oleoguttula sp. CCFEE 5521]